MSAPSPIFLGSTSLTEGPKSGTIEYGDRLSYTEIKTGPDAAAFTYAELHYRGAIFTFGVYGASSTLWIVDKTTLESDRGGVGTVTVNFTRIDGSTLPPEQFNLSPFEDNPPIEKNPFYATTLTNDDLAKAKASFEAASAAGKTSIDSVISAVTNATLVQKLINKWLKGELTYYLAAMKFQYTFYSFSAPTVSLGGIRQTPSGTFSSVIPGSMSWLRQADEVSWDNGIYKITRTWLGATGTPGWDSDLYP